MSYEYLSMVFFVVRAPTREGGKKKKKKSYRAQGSAHVSGGNNYYICRLKYGNVVCYNEINRVIVLLLHANNTIENKSMSLKL